MLHARQMAKSTLMVHTTARLRRERVAVAAFELTALGQNRTVELRQRAGLRDGLLVTDAPSHPAGTVRPSPHLQLLLPGIPFRRT